MGIQAPKPSSTYLDSMYPKMDGFFSQGKSIYQWMRTGSSPISGNYQILKVFVG
jgi:hypothetical protein